MRVVRVDRLGGPEVLVPADAPDPEAGPGQVVVDVDAVDVLFIETQLRRGWGREWFGTSPPYVPGDGVAGRVRETGPEVDLSWVGRSVVARTSPPATSGMIASSGGYADRAVVAADELLAVPDGVDARTAAALLHDGPTALMLMQAAEIVPGDWVLITAAGGGMGLLLVQLARAAGGRVIGAAGSTRKLEAIRALGAVAVIDYSRDGWVARARAAAADDGNPTGGVDVVLDGAGGRLGLAAFEAAGRGSRFLAYGASAGGFADLDGDETARRGVTVIGLFDLGADPHRTRRLTETVLAEAAAGRIRPVVGQTYPLERAADAHTAIEARSTVGKTLLLT